MAASQYACGVLYTPVVLAACGCAIPQDVVHRATVTVDEKGTVAAAATTVAVARKKRAHPRSELDIILDRPFVFAVCDLATQGVLFIGQINRV